VQGKRIARRIMLRERSIAGDQLGYGDEIEGSRGQHRQVKRLANMASGFRATRMLVEQAAARRKIQQNGACQHCQRLARYSPPEDRSAQLHGPQPSLTPLTHDPSTLVRKADLYLFPLLDPATIPA
jgi:hypothetical protein